VVFALIIGGIAAIDTHVSLGVIRRADEFRSSGSATSALRATAGISGTQCDALAGSPPLHASGAIRSGDPLRLGAMPDVTIHSWEVTASFVELLPHIAPVEVPAESSLTGVWLSADLAGMLGIRPGDDVATSLGSAVVGGIYEWPDDGRARELGFTILVPTDPQGDFDACWVHVWPQNTAATSLVYLSLTGAPEEAELGQLNARLGAQFNAHAAMESRLTRHAAGAALVLGAALGAAAMRLRRLELASALHARVAKSDLVAGQVLEALGWLIPGGVIALAGVVIPAAWIQRTIVHEAFVGELAAVGASVIAAGAAGALLATIVSVALSQEKHLFALFKSR
jgi:hypothetical protein